MVVLTVPQAYYYAGNAGFVGCGSSNCTSPADVIVAIAQAESGLDTNAVHRNIDGSIDRGILQINDRAHPEIGAGCAIDPQCAFNAGYTISSQGTNFTPWASYNNGSYRKFLHSGSQPPGPGPGPGPGPDPFPSYGGKPWYAYPISRGHGGLEHGVDLGVPLDTPITAVFAGTITDISGFAPGGGSGTSSSGWGGQITWRLDTPQAAHGAPYEYVIHLDAVNPGLQPGMHIDSGTLLGWSGGAVNASQVGNANNPVGIHTIDSSQYSTGPHTEIGLAEGPQFGVGAGFNNPDPTFMIALAQAESLPFGTGLIGGVSGFGLGVQSGLSGPASLAMGFTPNTQADIQNKYGFSQLSVDVHNTIVQYPGFYGICLALDEAEHFPGIVNYIGIQDLLPWNLVQDTWKSLYGTIVGNTMPIIIRGSFIIFGFIMLIALFWQLLKPGIGIAADLAVAGLAAA